MVFQGMGNVFLSRHTNRPNIEDIYSSMDMSREYGSSPKGRDPRTMPRQLERSIWNNQTLTMSEMFSWKNLQQIAGKMLIPNKALCESPITHRDFEEILNPLEVTSSKEEESSTVKQILNGTFDKLTSAFGMDHRKNSSKLPLKKQEFWEKLNQTRLRERLRMEEIRDENISKSLTPEKPPSGKNIWRQTCTQSSVSVSWELRRSENTSKMNINRSKFTRSFSDPGPNHHDPTEGQTTGARTDQLSNLCASVLKYLDLDISQRKNLTFGGEKSFLQRRNPDISAELTEMSNSDGSETGSSPIHETFFNFKIFRTGEPIYQRLPRIQTASPVHISLEVSHPQIITDIQLSPHHNLTLNLRGVCPSTNPFMMTTLKYNSHHFLSVKSVLGCHVSPLTYGIHHRQKYPSPLPQTDPGAHNVPSLHPISPPLTEPPPTPTLSVSPPSPCSSDFEMHESVKTILQFYNDHKPSSGQCVDDGCEDWWWDQDSEDSGAVVEQSRSRWPEWDDESIDPYCPLTGWRCQTGSEENLDKSASKEQFCTDGEVTQLEETEESDSSGRCSDQEGQFADHEVTVSSDQSDVSDSDFSSDLSTYGNDGSVETNLKDFSSSEDSDETPDLIGVEEGALGGSWDSVEGSCFSDDDYDEVGFDPESDQLWNELVNCDDPYDPLYGWWHSTVTESSSPTHRSCSDFNHKKVRFADSDQLVVVHPVPSSNGDYPEDRKGVWEQLARDRHRFEKRISHLGDIISPCLDDVHRMRKRALLKK